MKKPYISIIISILVFLSALPFLVGVFSSTDNFTYSGVVFNPIDGYSYLAKMQIGKSGDWLFRLPYTANPGDGRILYPFYILAGQVVNIASISVSAGFNFIRIFSYGCMVFILVRFSDRLRELSKVPHGLRIVILSAGGGFGWLLLPFGKFGADFWVSEGYPFLAGLANPHFPLAIGLMVLSVLVWQNKISGWRRMVPGGIALFLSILSPFGFVMMSLVLLVDWLWSRVERQNKYVFPLLIYVTGGLPYSLYQYWAVTSTPQLAAWTTQNQTPSPALWDVFLSFSPWIIIIILGWRFLYQLRTNPLVRLLILWVLSGFVLTVLPVDLQRRFLIGLYIPIAALGLIVLHHVAAMLKITINKMTVFITGAIIPTTLLLIIMVSTAIGSHNTMYYFQQDEKSAIDWLGAREGGRLLVLSGEETGMFIPAVSRLRVIYGHPFETINAEIEKKNVADFFAGNLSMEEEEILLREKKIDWIFYGQREKALGNPLVLQAKQPDMVFGSVMLFHAAEWLD